MCMVLWDTLHPLYLKSLSTKQDWLHIVNGFKTRWNFPHCLGAFDGKHVTIQAPAKSGSLFFNYKKQFSIVLLAVCDSQYRFTLVDIGAYGSQSDGGIFKESVFGTRFEQQAFNILDPEVLDETFNIEMPPNGYKNQYNNGPNNYQNNQNPNRNQYSSNNPNFNQQRPSFSSQNQNQNRPSVIQRNENFQRAHVLNEYPDEMTTNYCTDDYYTDNYYNTDNYETDYYTENNIQTDNFYETNNTLDTENYQDFLSLQNQNHPPNHTNHSTDITNIQEQIQALNLDNFHPYLNFPEQRFL
ncbi:putative uncharacterized protein DDB_G0288537 [Diabrotica virgifera virgifera]|uniref:DDE Tnp4 domain-containing protein n=1 Tax=Diabrotica virgifera virgifera TaxID=50390 RepID=A0ABM5L199_DIAVI|nr:putative uncharacterized protein DDB_G0288537 [Diabrotica virgifera virgifera]